MKRFLPSLILTVPFFIGCPGGESSDDSAAALLLLGAGESDPTTCNYQTTHGTTVATALTVRTDGAGTVPSTTASGSGTFWTAVIIPAVKSGTTITFNYNPAYVHTGAVTVYESSGCPIVDGTTPSFADFNASYGATTTITIQPAGAGKNIIILSSPNSDPSGKTVTRTDP
jgi:hypothetical protein